MKMEDFDKWLKELVYPKEVDDFIEVIYDGGQSQDDGTYEIKKEVAFYTDDNKYFIVAVEREMKKGRIECVANARKSRAGETWTRGNDLADGPFTRKTLERIKNRIIAYELIKLSVRSIQPPVNEDSDNCGG